MKNEVKNGRYVDKYGTVSCYKNGQRHREDGPAVEWKDGTKEWWLNGQRHREGGPAVEWSDGSKYWYKDGKRHREDGPAIEWAHGDKTWWLNDIQKTEEEFNQWLEKKLLNERLQQTLEEKPQGKKVKI